MITKALQTLLLHRWGHLLDFDHERLSKERLQLFADVIHDRRAPLTTCWGFIDGTIYQIARPIWFQKGCYNGWKQKHCVKYYAMVSPHGIICHLYGPVEGRQNDAHLFNKSGLWQYLQTYFFGEDEQLLQIYGDPAYGVSAHLLSLFKCAQITLQQQ